MVRPTKSPDLSADTLINILLVDDEPRNLDVLETLLEAPDRQLVRAETAEEALLALIHGDFACIVLDIQMPTVSGIQLARLIKTRKRSQHIPIIFVTAHFQDPKDILQGYGAGAVDYLTKPIDPLILKSKVGVFVELFRMTHALARTNRALKQENVQRQQAEDALRETNAELEGRVKDRTADLSRANQDLRQTEERYRQLVRGLPAALYTVDAQGRVTLYNEAAVALWGQEPVVGQDPWGESFGMYRPDGSRLPRSECPMAVALRESRPVRGEEIVIERPDGSRRHVLAYPDPILDASGVVVGAVNLLMDITERKRADEARAHLASIVESSDDAIMSEDLAGVIRSWNPGAERVFGYTAAEVIGRSSALLSPPERVEEDKQILARLQQGERIDHFETVRLRKDGVPVAVSLTLSPVKDITGRVIGASRIARDITEAKRVEQALRESEERFRTMANAAPVMIWMSGADTLCTFFNQAWLDFTGRPLAEELGQGWTTAVHPEDLPLCLKIRAESLERKQPFKADYRLRRADGDYRWITDHGVPRFTPDGKLLGYIGGGIDITERKQSEERFVRLNETLVSVLESIPDIVFVTGVHGRIQFKNPAGSRFINMIATKDQLPAPIHAELDRVMQTGEHHLPTSFKTVHPFLIGQQERFFLSRIVAMKTPDQRVFGAVVMLQDVTEFRLLDEVKTNLISTVSHELKTPMTSLRTALLLLSEQTVGPLTDKQAEMLEIARDEAERLLRTLNELLDLTRFEEDAIEMRLDAVSVSELIQAAVEDTQSSAASARMAIKLELEPDLPVLKVHRERILHVLTNFLSNAIRYSAEGKEIVVRARKDPAGMYFGVADSGPGVPRPYQTRIFEKFVRVPGTPKKGVGLGLSIAREFVRAHGGRIGVHSEPGHGSEFYFILPTD